MHAKSCTSQRDAVNNARPLPSCPRAGYNVRQATSGQVDPVASTGQNPSNLTSRESPGAVATSLRIASQTRGQVCAQFERQYPVIIDVSASLIIK